MTRYFLFLLAITFYISLPCFANADSRTPVIVVPGYLASWNNSLFVSPSFEDKWEFTIGDDTYDNLIKSFQDKGYVFGQDLFVAYYDWRQSNRTNYQDYLVPVIDKALAKNAGQSSVDVVAHSMGGIFTRAYVQSLDYRDDIRNFIMIATPNHGSADAYYLWSGGQMPPSFVGKEKTKASLFLFYRGLTYAPAIFSRRQLIQKDIPSTEELLPVSDFLVDFATGLDLPVSGMKVQNPFLPGLNKRGSTNGISAVADNVDKLTIIAGRGRDTIERIAVDTRTTGERWYDGKPIKNGIAYSQIGDGSVLGVSAFFPLLHLNTDCLGGPPPVLAWLIKTANACELYTFKYGIESIPGWHHIRQEYIYDAGHRDVVTKAIPIVHQVLGNTIASGYYYDSPDVSEVLGFAIASPIDPVVVDPSGKRFGKNINEIGDSAEYFDANDPLGPKILIIENPLDGTYKIETTGTGDGDFHIGVMKLTEESGDPIGSTEDMVLPTIGGSASVGGKQNFEVESLGEGLVVEGEVYGDLPVITVSTSDQIMMRQIILILEELRSSGGIKKSTASILLRSFNSRIKQMNARDKYKKEGSLIYVQVYRANILQQLRSHQSYIDFMTKIRQITPEARDKLVSKLEQIISEL